MNLTEDEAKQRWCPFANVNFAGRLPGNANRIQKTGQDSSGQNAMLGETIIPAGAKCLGSACMAWRFATPAGRAYPYIVTLPGKEPERYAWDPSGTYSGVGVHPGYEEAKVERAPPEPGVGHCGLAG